MILNGTSIWLDKEKKKKLKAKNNISLEKKSLFYLLSLFLIKKKKVNI